MTTGGQHTKITNWFKFGTYKGSINVGDVLLHSVSMQRHYIYQSTLVSRSAYLTAFCIQSFSLWHIPQHRQTQRLWILMSYELLQLAGSLHFVQCKRVVHISQKSRLNRMQIGTFFKHLQWHKNYFTPSFKHRNKGNNKCCQQNIKNFNETSLCLHLLFVFGVTWPIFSRSFALTMCSCQAQDVAVMS